MADTHTPEPWEIDEQRNEDGGVLIWGAPRTSDGASWFVGMIEKEEDARRIVKCVNDAAKRDAAFVP